VHECAHHAGAGPGHSCSFTLRNAGKCIKGAESPAKPLGHSTPKVVLLATLPRLIPSWVPKLFLEACRREHAPPAFLPGALS
jgi:hypothetical protein